MFLGCEHAGYSSDSRIFGLASGGHRFVKTAYDSFRVTSLSLRRQIEAFSADARLTLFFSIVSNFLLNNLLLEYKKTRHEPLGTNSMSSN